MADILTNLPMNAERSIVKTEVNPYKLNTCIDNILMRVDRLEAKFADTQTVRRGKWDGYICSECNAFADYFISGDFYFDEKPNFCPNCGAKMTKE